MKGETMNDKQLLRLNAIYEMQARMTFGKFDASKFEMTVQALGALLEELEPTSVEGKKRQTVTA